MSTTTANILDTLSGEFSLKNELTSGFVALKQGLVKGRFKEREALKSRLSAANNDLFIKKRTEREGKQLVVISEYIERKSNKVVAIHRFLLPPSLPRKKPNEEDDHDDDEAMERPGISKKSKEKYSSADPEDVKKSKKEKQQQSGNQKKQSKTESLPEKRLTVRTPVLRPTFCRPRR